MIEHLVSNCQPRRGGALKFGILGGSSSESGNHGARITPLLLSNLRFLIDD